MDDTNQKLEPLRVNRNPVVIGTGLVALDVVIPSGLESDPQLRAGGTCGNVLTALSYLGWGSYPVARLCEDGASKLVASDLRQWGVHLDFVTFDHDGSTPVIVQHIRNSKSGAPTHSFSRKCPCCGAILPWYKAIRVVDVTDLAPKLPKPQVYFFDRTSRGALALARQASERGAVVFFEPSASSEPGLLEEALDLAHIVKLSSDRINGNESVLTASKPKIIIETRGSTGLRLRLTNSERERGGTKWHEMSPIPVDCLRDTAGAGDWCSAGIIHMLGAMGAKGLDDLTLAEVRQAVQVGQAMASWTCGFDGPRGGMYVSEKADFQRGILGSLNGRSELAADMKKTSPTPGSHVFACESCRAKEKPQTAVRKSRK